jgi:hypothetical protein
VFCWCLAFISQDGKPPILLAFKMFLSPASVGFGPLAFGGFFPSEMILVPLSQI